MKIGFAILATVGLLTYTLSHDAALAIAVSAFVLALMPPSIDPAIQIKEWQIKQGWHPESPLAPPPKPDDAPPPTRPTR